MAQSRVFVRRSIPSSELRLAKTQSHTFAISKMGPDKPDLTLRNPRPFQCQGESGSQVQATWELHTTIVACFCWLHAVAGFKDLR
jgi:hypothetical protein